MPFNPLTELGQLLGQALAGQVAATIVQGAEAACRGMRDRYRRQDAEREAKEKQKQHQENLSALRTRLYLSDASRYRAMEVEGIYDPMAEHDREAAADVVAEEPGLEVAPPSVDEAFVVIIAKDERSMTFLEKHLDDEFVQVTPEEGDFEQEVEETEG
ncbi:hypothetical protein MKZ38_004718 [Zalerion maritima]|uniref:Uncharacterized protein n=1 Tax=Zalerion maritima TaxID=339359 RepID=A0AAD5WUD6_9PEZI|nr:hypothetical protein MKZ38_004718 [Zalerion maritima]